MIPLLFEPELLFDSLDESLLEVFRVHWQHGEFSVQFDPEMSTFATRERSTLLLEPSLELAALHITSINNFVYSCANAGGDSISMSIPSCSELDLEAESGGARRSEGGGWGFGDFDLAVEEVFAGGKKSEALADVVRGVGVKAEVAVEQKDVGIVVVLASAQAALQAECADLWTEGTQVEGGHVASDFGDPVAEVMRAAADGGLRVLIAAVDAQFVGGREREAWG